MAPLPADAEEGARLVIAGTGFVTGVVTGGGDPPPHPAAANKDNAAMLTVKR
jgi:hypothetical protein